MPEKKATIPRLTASVVPVCKDCKVRSRYNAPRTRELGVCLPCYERNHNYHVCPCDGCPQCEGE